MKIETKRYTLEQGGQLKDIIGEIDEWSTERNGVAGVSGYICEEDQHFPAMAANLITNYGFPASLAFLAGVAHVTDDTSILCDIGARVPKVELDGADLWFRGEDDMSVIVDTVHRTWRLFADDLEGVLRKLVWFL